jgi:hypothetical protein
MNNGFVAIAALLLFGCCCQTIGQPPALTPALACEKTKDADMMNWCLGAVNLDSGYCDKIVDPGGSKGQKSNCYFIVGIRNKDSDVCQHVTKPEDMNGCLAIAEGNVSRCDILEDGYKETCIKYFAAFTLNSEPCANLSGKQNCYEMVARYSDDASTCEMDASSNNSGCYYNVAVHAMDSSVCEQVSDADSKSTCLAITKNDTSLCPSGANHNSCLGYAAMSNGDYEGCISATGNADQCYFYIATKGKERFF